MTSTTTKAKQRLQSFRKLNPRIDLYPGEKAYAAIMKMKAKYPTFSVREIVDILVLDGLNIHFPGGASG